MRHPLAREERKRRKWTEGHSGWVSRRSCNRISLPSRRRRWPDAEDPDDDARDFFDRVPDDSGGASKSMSMHALRTILSICGEDGSQSHDGVPPRWMISSRRSASSSPSSPPPSPAAPSPSPRPPRRRRRRENDDEDEVDDVSSVTNFPSASHSRPNPSKGISSMPRQSLRRYTPKVDSPSSEIIVADVVEVDVPARRPCHESRRFIKSSTDADASINTDKRAREGGDLNPPPLPPPLLPPVRW